MSLLDKASLVQIPSGYGDGKLYSVKPTPTFGSELAINGDFTTDSDWTKNSGWSIVNGEAVHTGSGDYIQQGSLVQGTKYRVVIVVTQASGSGFPQIYMGGLQTAMTSPNTYTFDITAQSGDKIKLRGLNDCKVDSISVKEILVEDSDFDFSRSSTGTRVNADGLIEEVPWNLNTYSEDFTNVSYIKDSGITIGSTNNVSPIGNNTATQIDVTNSGRIYKNVTSAEYRTSIYLKAGTFAYFKFANSLIDLNLGTINSPYSSSIEDVGNGWYRIAVSFIATTRPFQVQAYPDNTYTTHTQSGNYFIWGSMLNYGDTTKPYIKTTDRLDVPRLNYSGGASCASLLLEPQRTNLNIQSNSSFVTNSCTIDYNNATSPEGITNAYRATATGTSASFVRSNNISFTDPSAFSVFFKYGNNQWMQIINAGSVNHYVNVDIQNGVFGTNGSDTSDLLIEDYGNGWYRVSGKFSGYSGTGTLRVYMGSNSSAVWASASAIVGNYYYGYGFQVESNASYATSYIPTSGSTVTRTADVCNNAGTSATFNDSEGVLFFEGSYFEDIIGNVISLSNGSNTDVIYFRTDTIERFKFFVGSNSYLTNFNEYDVSENHKIALLYSTNSFKVFIDGVKKHDTTISFIPSIVYDRLNFSTQGGGTPFYGKCKQLIYFNEALTDSELEALTTI